MQHPPTLPSTRPHIQGVENGCFLPYWARALQMDQGTDGWTDVQRMDRQMDRQIDKSTDGPTVSYEVASPE